MSHICSLSLPNRAHRRALGRPATLMLVAVFMLALMDTSIKLLADYPPLQVAALRGLSSLPLVLGWVFATVGIRSVLRPRWSLHLFRGVLGIVMLTCFAAGVRTIPLSTAYSIFFVAPLLITLFAAMILRESIGPLRWAAVLLGLVGTLIILRPSSDGVDFWGGLAVLIAATGYAISAITVRILGATDSSQSMVLWLVIFLSLGAGLLALPHWQQIAREHWHLVALMGCCGALGQIALTEAFRRGEASLLAPLEYSALAWGLGLDLLLWQALPDARTWLGAAMIVGCGLILLRRDRRRIACQPGRS